MLRGPQTTRGLAWRCFAAAAAFAAVATSLITPPFVDPNVNPDATVATLQEQMAAEASARAVSLPSVATAPEPELTATPEPTTTSRARTRARATTTPTTPTTPTTTRTRRSSAPSTTPRTSAPETDEPDGSETDEPEDEAPETGTDEADSDDGGGGDDDGESTGAPPPTMTAGGGARFLAIARAIADGPRVRYNWGGKDIDQGVDCSGFVWNVLRRGGLDVPYRNSTALARWGTSVSKADARPGDLALWRGHVAIYAGGDMIVDASSSADDITERKLWGRPTFRRIPS